MRIAFLGCGYVSNMYRLTMEKYPELELSGVFDVERSRAETMARLTKSKVYSSFDVTAQVVFKRISVLL